MAQHTCDSCEATFEDSDELRTHVRDEHGEKTETNQRQEGEKSPYESEQGGDEGTAG